MITSQFCVTDHVKLSDIIRAFGVTSISVKWSVKIYRDQGPEGFYAARVTRGPAVLVEDVVSEIEGRLAGGAASMEGRCRTQINASSIPPVIPRMVGLVPGVRVRRQLQRLGPLVAVSLQPRALPTSFMRMPIPLRFRPSTGCGSWTCLGRRRCPGRPSFPLAVVGSPDYLRRRQRPELIDDLRQHAYLRVRRSNGSIAPWSFVNGNEAVEVILSGPFIANDIPTMLGAAVEGSGLAPAPGPIAAGAMKAGKPVGVLEPFAPMAPGVFLYYPGYRQMMPKLRAFIDHVKSRPDAGGRVRVAPR
jgi:DNA-binding transcriptional LysR family regulator